MDSADYVFQSDFALRNQAQGKAEGKAEGELEALLMVLTARGIGLSDSIRERITGCRDMDQLDKWIAKAATANTAHELFG